MCHSLPAQVRDLIHQALSRAAVARNRGSHERTLARDCTTEIVVPIQKEILVALQNTIAAIPFEVRMRGKSTQ